jgi:hypothetical protein
MSRASPQPADTGFVCFNCGERWPQHPVLQVPCPDCRAPAGAQCRRPSGHRAWRGQPHIAREQSALDAGVLAMCPQGPTATGARINPQLSLFEIGGA